MYRTFWITKFLSNFLNSVVCSTSIFLRQSYSFDFYLVYGCIYCNRSTISFFFTNTFSVLKSIYFIVYRTCMSVSVLKLSANLSSSHLFFSNKVWTICKSYLFKRPILTCCCEKRKSESINSRFYTSGDIRFM